MRIEELTQKFKLDAFYKAYLEQEIQPEYSDIPFSKRLLALLESEEISRDNKKLERLLRQSKLPLKGANISDITFNANRGIDKSVILDLSSCKYLKYFKNIILTGATGTGKSFISQAFATKAMGLGYSALYLRVPRLMQHLQSIRGDEEYIKYLERLKKINLLILDDFGVSPLKAAEARDLLEIVEDRTNLSSLIITSQLPIKEWHSYLHNPTIADAILDRIVHNSYKINLEGESQRKEKAKNSKN